MKKIRFIIAGIIRGTLVLLPGLLCLWWLWAKVAALVAFLASIGLETLWLIVLSFVVLTVQAWREHKKVPAEKETD